MELNREQIDTQVTEIQANEMTDELDDMRQRKLGYVKWYTFECHRNGDTVDFNDGQIGYLIDAHISENEILHNGLVFKLKYTCWRLKDEIPWHIDNDDPRLPIRKYIWN